METTSALEELATRLMTPAKSGFYMTKNELIVLARLSDASLRVNERKQMLMDIFKSMQSEEEFIALLERIEAFARRRKEQFEELGRDFPQSSEVMEGYIKPLEKLFDDMEEIKAEVRL